MPNVNTHSLSIASVVGDTTSHPIHNNASAGRTIPSTDRTGIFYFMRRIIDIAFYLGWACDVFIFEEVFFEGFIIPWMKPRANSY